MPVNLGDLRTFVTVVRLGSMRRAADHLSLVPSIVTRQIGRLEKAYGKTLFERRPDGVTLTHAGRIVCQGAEELLRMQANLEADLTREGKTRQAIVRIYTIEGITRAFLTPLVSRCRQDMPETMFSITVVGRKLVLGAIEDYEAEVAFVYDHFSNPNVEKIASWQQPLLAFVRPGHRLLKDECRVADLAATPCALPDETFAIRRLVEAAYKARNLNLKPAVVANHLQTLIHAAIGDDIVTYMPLQAARIEVERGDLVPLKTPFREFEYRFASVVVHKARPRGAHVEAFLDAVKSAIPQAEAADRRLLEALAPIRLIQE